MSNSFAFEPAAPVTALAESECLALLRAARALALLLGRDHVLPEDVQTLFPAVAAHRLVADADGGDGRRLATAILQAVAVD